MEDTVRRYISYEASGEMKLALKTTLFGGYDRAETCDMVRNLTDYYKEHIMQLLDEVSKKEDEIHALRHTENTVTRVPG